MATTMYAPSTTPMLDAINSLMTRVESGGQMPTGVVVGMDLVAVINAEVVVLGVPDCSVDPAHPRIFGVPVLIVEQSGRLAVMAG